MEKKKWFLSRKKGLKRKAAPAETQEAAASEDGMAESRVQPLKPAGFPPGLSISETKKKQWWHLMFGRNSSSGRKS